jgi:hypothetical protein
VLTVASTLQNAGWRPLHGRTNDLWWRLGDMLIRLTACNQNEAAASLYYEHEDSREFINQWRGGTIMLNMLLVDLVSYR